MRNWYSSVAVVTPLFGAPQTLLLLDVTPYVLAGLGCRMVLAKDRNREVAQLVGGNPGTGKIRYSLVFALSALARISHHLTAEARDRPAITSLRLLAVLNVLRMARLRPYRRYRDG